MAVNLERELRQAKRRIAELQAENERLLAVVDAIKTLHTWGTKEVDTQKCILITMQSWERLEEAFAALDEKQR